MRVFLRHVAHTRSGDKGNVATISVIAYSDVFYPHLKAQLTAAAFKRHYGDAVRGTVDRYEVDRISALNFSAQGALGGGVSRSLALDNYGKALCSALLNFEIIIPDGIETTFVDGPGRRLSPFRRAPKKMRHGLLDSED